MEEGKGDTLDFAGKIDCNPLPDRDAVCGAVNDIGHHSRTFVQVDEGDDVRHELIERRGPALTHNREGVDRAPTRCLSPCELTGAAAAKRSWIELETVTGRAILD